MYTLKSLVVSLLVVGAIYQPLYAGAGVDPLKDKQEPRPQILLSANSAKFDSIVVAQTEVSAKEKPRVASTEEDTARVPVHVLEHRKNSLLRGYEAGYYAQDLTTDWTGVGGFFWGSLSGPLIGPLMPLVNIKGDNPSTWNIVKHYAYKSGDLAFVEGYFQGYRDHSHKKKKRNFIIGAYIGSFVSTAILIKYDWHRKFWD